MKKIRQIAHPITQEQLYDIVDIWIEAAMDLSRKDLKKMDRLLQLQKDTKTSKTIREKYSEKTPRQGEWRKITDVEFPLTTHLGENIPRNRRKNTGCRRRTMAPQED